VYNPWDKVYREIKDKSSFMEGFSLGPDCCGFDSTVEDCGLPVYNQGLCV